MKKFNFLLVVLVLVSLFSGCTKDEVPVPESEDTALKAASREKITIIKTLPNGKEITLEIPVTAVNEIIDQSPKLPYSPEGVYVFKHKYSPYPEFDVFITSFDGVWTKGTFGYPAGGSYTLTGEVEFSGLVSLHKLTGFRIFSGVIIINSEKKVPFEVWTSESGGIIKDWAIDEYNEFLVIRTEPYSTEGHYVICEYKEPGDETPLRYIEVWITSFDNNEFTGKYISENSLGDLEGFGEIEGSTMMKGEEVLFTMDLFLKLKEDGILWKTIEGTVDISEGFDDYFEPYDFPPPSIIVVP